MELFSEIYNCYYQIIDVILKNAERSPITQTDMGRICEEQGFGESGLYILPRLMSGEWALLSATDGQHYTARTTAHQNLPLTYLQRSWLKTLLQDARIRLFFDDESLHALENYVRDAALLWQTEDFYYYDQFKDGDHYSLDGYRKHFRTLLSAINKKQYVNISFQSSRGNRITHHYLPLNLEYSIKNDRFRLIAVPEERRRSIFLNTINLDSITEAAPLERFHTEDLNYKALIRKSYYREPLHLLIKNQRNALERTMLHFANYEKQTKKIDEDTWECLIYYNHSMETELLIEVLSFGPALKVLGPKSFLRQIRDRIQRQKALFLEAEQNIPGAQSPNDGSGSP